MPRQDSLTDQLDDVEKAAHSAGVSITEWRKGGPMPPREDVWKARMLAINLGCYDADDWMRSRMPGGYRTN